MGERKISVVIVERQERYTTVAVNVRLPFCDKLSFLERQYLSNELKKSVRVALMIQFGQRAANIDRMRDPTILHPEEEISESDLFSLK